jgi:DNA-binding beta-propeller fold protein YncE
MVKAHLAHAKSVLVLATLLMSACSTTPDVLEFSMPSVASGTDQQKRWPEAPEVPRYLYVGDLMGESNKLANPNEKRSASERFFAALVGLDSDAIPLTNLLRPQQVTTDGRGKIYVTDPGRQSIFVFDEATGRFSLWNESSLGVSLASPIGIAIADQKILVSDAEQALILVFDEQGNLLSRIGDGQLKRPTGLCYDSLQQEIVVADTDADVIRVYDMQGTLIDTLGSLGDQPGQFNHPTYIHCREGKIYVTDSLNARIQVIDRVDESVQVIGERGLYVGNFSRPKGIAVDYDGNIYITESYYDYLLIFNAEGELLLAIGGSGNEPGQFSQPTGVWIDANGRLFISDMLNSRISIFQYLGEG